VNAAPDLATRAEDQLIADALRVLEQRARYTTTALASPQDVKDYLRLRLGGLEHEVFAVVWLDAQHRVIECEEMFRGTITQTCVYPREVLKSALAHNAAAVILAHNHPSGESLPSRADENLTAALKTALALIDVRVLDHVVVSSQSATSFAEKGLI
jgi:DNA repair protein RadC